MHVSWHRHRELRPDRLFTFEELRLTAECAFQAGREVGWRAAGQLGNAARRYRTYLIVSELQRLEQALALAGATGEAAGVTRAIAVIRREFSATTPEEAAALGVDGSGPWWGVPSGTGSGGGRPAGRPQRLIER